MDIDILLFTLGWLYTIGGGLYGVHLLTVLQYKYATDIPLLPGLVFSLIMGYLWPIMFVFRVVKHRKEIRHRKAVLMKRLHEVRSNQERQAAIKAKADEAEEAWRHINEGIGKKTADKRKKYAAEHYQWDLEEGQVSDDAYRKLNFSAIREARLRARSEGDNRNADKLTRILEDKTLEAATNYDLLDSLSPEERQNVVARATEIKQERWEKMRWGFVRDNFS